MQKLKKNLCSRSKLTKKKRWESKADDFIPSYFSILTVL